MHKIIQNQYICHVLAIFFILALCTGTCFAEFTIDDEIKLGREFHEKLVKQQLLLENKRLNDYITKIGNLILKETKQAPFTFRFFVINSSAINAFATPGGYIYINKGLINVVESEAELAGVIAHEISHANARHIARIIEKSKKLNMATLAAVLAGVLLGGGGEASAAIAAFSIAGAASLNLKYSREHEEEADRMGMDYLTKAGYYPAAMIDFLKTMRKYEFLSKNMPSYLLTHPGTDERILYLENLIQTSYPMKGARNIVGNLIRMQALNSLYMDDLTVRYKRLENLLADNPEDVDLLYAIALLEDKLGRSGEAVERYLKALNLSPQDEDILKNLGLAYFKLGKPQTALNYLLRAQKINADNEEVTLALGKTYDALGQYKESLDCYLKLENKEIDDKDISYYIASAYGKLNNKGDSHYNFGLHFKKLKRKDSAVFHFNEALKYFPPGSQKANLINAELKSLSK